MLKYAGWVFIVVQDMHLQQESKFIYPKMLNYCFK